LIEETTRQFQKFEDDILKVEGILRAKEEYGDRMERENRGMIKDKVALIEALEQK
jgi:hypothetical protein